MSTKFRTVEAPTSSQGENRAVAQPADWPENRSADIVYHGGLSVQAVPQSLTPPNKVIAQAAARFDAAAGAPDDARSAVAGFASDSGLSHALQLKAELVTEELVTNTLNHGEAPPCSVIELRLALTESALLIEYADRGREFDPTTASSPRHRDPWHVGGFGWDLVRGMCTEVEYARVGDCNQLRLRIDVAQVGPR